MMRFGPGYMMLCAEEQTQIDQPGDLTSKSSRTGLERTPDIVVAERGDDLDAPTAEDRVHSVGNHPVRIVDLVRRPRQSPRDVVPGVVPRPCKRRWSWRVSRRTSKLHEMVGVRDRQMTKSTSSAQFFSSQSNVRFMSASGESQSLHSPSRLKSTFRSRTGLMMTSVSGAKRTMGQSPNDLLCADHPDRRRG